MSEDYQDRQIAQLTETMRLMREEQTRRDIAFAKWQGSVDQKLEALTSRSDSTMGGLLKAAGVALAAFLTLILATVFPGGIDI